MITVSEIIEESLQQKPYLEEALAEGLINYSSLARKLLPEVRKKTMKPIQEGAVLMALRRLSLAKQKTVTKHKLFPENPDMIIRSNLFEVTVSNHFFTSNLHRELVSLVENNGNHFLTISQGVHETTIIASLELEAIILKLFPQETIIGRFEDLSSLTLKIAEKSVQLPGVFYFVIRMLALENISIIEIVSTYTELTLILKDKEIDRAFSLLKDGLTVSRKK